MFNLSVTDESSEYGYDETRYRRLWRLVLIQVIGEAAGRSNKMLGVSPVAWKREIGRAQQWLRTDSPDLRQVCDLAGLSSEMLLQYGRKKYGRSKK